MDRNQDLLAGRLSPLIAQGKNQFKHLFILLNTAFWKIWEATLFATCGSQHHGELACFEFKLKSSFFFLFRFYSKSLKEIFSFAIVANGLFNQPVHPEWAEGLVSSQPKDDGSLWIVDGKDFTDASVAKVCDSANK